MMNLDIFVALCWNLSSISVSLLYRKVKNYWTEREESLCLAYWHTPNAAQDSPSLSLARQQHWLMFSVVSSGIPSFIWGLISSVQIIAYDKYSIFHSKNNQRSHSYDNTGKKNPDKKLEFRATQFQCLQHPTPRISGSRLNTDLLHDTTSQGFITRCGVEWF